MGLTLAQGVELVEVGEEGVQECRVHSLQGMLRTLREWEDSVLSSRGVRGLPMILYFQRPAEFLRLLLGGPRCLTWATLGFLQLVVHERGLLRVCAIQGVQ